MTPEQLDEIEARASAATQGPWREDRFSNGLVTECGRVDIHGDPLTVSENVYMLADREFITSARTDVPALVAEIRRLRAQTEQLLADLKAATDAQYTRNLVIMRLQQTLGGNSHD